MNTSCKFCKLQLKNEKDLFSHLRDFHLHDHGFEVECNIQGCSLPFKTFNALYIHRHRHHSGYKPTPSCYIPNTGLTDNSHVTTDTIQQETQFSSLVDEGNNTELQIAKFILYLRATTNITSSNLSIILQKMQDLIQKEVSSTINKIDDVLQTEKSISLSDVIDTKEMIESSIMGFKNLNSVHKQDSYFNKKFRVIKPVPVSLSRAIVPAGRMNNSMQYKIKDLSMAYIPLAEIVNNVLQNNTMRKIISEKINNERNVLLSFQDGLLFQKCAFLKQHPDALQFILYYDELEVCNPLGSKAGVQKLGMFYMVFGNIPPKYRSALKMIHLVAVVKAAHVKLHGMDKILEPIVRDLHLFEKGLVLQNGSKIFGRLIALTGDNLGVHGVAGLKEGFTALHCCRFCMAEIDDVRKLYTEVQHLIRTEEKHEKQIEELSAASGTEKKEVSKMYGINRGSLLSSLENYHVIDGIPPDIMHDVLEGVLPLTIRLFLNKVCIEDKLISLTELNQRIAQFDYGYSESPNKPSLIKHLDSLHQTASQTWLLAYILPLIIADYIPNDCPYFENYLILLEASSIIFSPCPSKTMIDYLQICIEEYLESFQTLYEKTLIPKQHFLTHYPNLLMKYGPLIHFWSMRMEAKHQYFKEIVHNMRNYKNIPMSLATKHQLYQAHILQSSLDSNIQCGPVKRVARQSLPFSSLLENLNENVIYTMPWILIYGTKYVSKKCFVILNFEDGIYQFGKLENILYVNNLPLFVCLKSESVVRNVDLCSYEITVGEDFVVVDPKTLDFHMIFHLHKVADKNLIILKQAFYDLY